MTVISGNMTNIFLRSQEPEQNMTKQRRTVNPRHRFILSNVQESTPCLACQWLSLSLSVVLFVSQQSDPPTNTTRCFRVFYSSVHSVYFHTHIHYCLQPGIPWYGWKNWGNFRNIFNKLAEGLIQGCDTAALDSNLVFFSSSLTISMWQGETPATLTFGHTSVWHAKLSSFMTSAIQIGFIHTYPHVEAHYISSVNTKALAF